MEFRQAIANRIVVVDGAMGTQIQALGLTDADFGGAEYKMLSDLLIFSRPDAVVDIHLGYLRAGANAVETNTFGASPLRLAEYDFSGLDTTHFTAAPLDADLRSMDPQDIAYRLSRFGSELARRACDEHRQDEGYDNRPLFVIGSIGPSNRVISSTQANLARATFDEIADNFHTQALGLIDGGADVLLFETQQDILELKAGVFGAKRAMAERGTELPIMAQVTVDSYARMQIFHTDIQAALTTIQDLGVETFGINCSIGPDLMKPAVEKLARHSRLPISVIPNAGLPKSEAGETVFDFEPGQMAELLGDFVENFGVNVVGGCCGTTPGHIAAIAERVQGLQPKRREPDTMVYVSGPQQAVALDSGDNLLRIGERLNVRGSKKVREAVEGDGPVDHETLEDVVREQVEGLGLNVIDVCMDSNIVDTTETLKDVVHRQTTDFAGAMSIDSFAPDALFEAVKVYPGRPIINSISMEEFEEGKTKADMVIDGTKAHNPVYIGLVAGPEGPAATASGKADLARQLYEAVQRHGLSAEHLIVDVNVFPIGSESDPNMNFALESINSIPLVKEIDPGLKTIVGVGNLTNGLAKKPYMRRVLTSTWVDEARKKGLDAAIINPNHYVFVEDLDQDHYQLARKVILERDMDAFEELERIAEEKSGQTVTVRTTYDDLSPEDAICRKIVDGYKSREAGSVEVDGRAYEFQDRIVEQMASIVHEHEPLVFINDYLMAAMQELGDGFAKGEVSLPHLLKSADVMKQVMGFLEKYMKVSSGVDVHDEINYKGTVVIGTVYQDVHSIGKDLAKTLLENYGYRVIDLGVMTPLQKYLDSAIENDADAIGMSALLVQTSNHMITVSKMMQEQGMSEMPVLIGGAPVNYRHAAYVAMGGGEDRDSMRDNVFYCPTAMDGVNVMNDWVEGGAKRQAAVEKNCKKLHSSFEQAKERSAKEAQLLEELPRRAIDFSEHRLPERPWLAPEAVRIRLSEIEPQIDRKTLFGLNWKFGGRKKREERGETDDKLEALLQEWLERCEEEGWLKPQGVMAVYPCCSDGEEIMLVEPDNYDKEVARFDFAPVVGSRKKDVVCAADYFKPMGNGGVDAVGLQLCTAGPEVEDQINAFRESGDSESCLYLQGLSDRIAEDVAGLLHSRLRERLGFSGDSDIGIRWSPGYPAMPNTDNNRGLLELLQAEKHIGVRITEAGEFAPTGTTGAVVCFHPDARYT